MQPYSLRKLYDGCSRVSTDIVLYLPRTSDLNEIAELAKDGKQIPVTHYCMRGASKACTGKFARVYHADVQLQALCAYLGDFSFDE